MAAVVNSLRKPILNLPPKLNLDNGKAKIAMTFGLVLAGDATC